eukprot:gene4246-4954_t
MSTIKYSTRPITFSKELEDLEKLLQQGGEISDIGVLTYPLSQDTVQCIIERYGARDAPQEETTLESIRNVWHIDTSVIKLSDTWSSQILYRILPEVSKGLGIEGQIEASLDRVLIYSEGEFSLPCASPNARTLATLMISLPSVHRGGHLTLQSHGRVVTLNLENDTKDSLNYAAYRPNVSQTINKITSGTADLRVPNGRGGVHTIKRLQIDTKSEIFNSSARDGFLPSYDDVERAGGDLKGYKRAAITIWPKSKDKDILFSKFEFKDMLDYVKTDVEAKGGIATNKAYAIDLFSKVSTAAAKSGVDTDPAYIMDYLLSLPEPVGKVVTGIIGDLMVYMANNFAQTNPYFSSYFDRSMDHIVEGKLNSIVTTLTKGLLVTSDLYLPILSLMVRRDRLATYKKRFATTVIEAMIIKGKPQTKIPFAPLFDRWDYAFKCGVDINTLDVYSRMINMDHSRIDLPFDLALQIINRIKTDKLPCISMIITHLSMCPDAALRIDELAPLLSHQDTASLLISFAKGCKLFEDPDGPFDLLAKIVVSPNLFPAETAHSYAKELAKRIQANKSSAPCLTAIRFSSFWAMLAHLNLPDLQEMLTDRLKTIKKTYDTMVWVADILISLRKQCGNALWPSVTQDVWAVWIRAAKYLVRCDEKAYVIHNNALEERRTMCKKPVCLRCDNLSSFLTDPVQVEFTVTAQKPEITHLEDMIIWHPRIKSVTTPISSYQSRLKLTKCMKNRRTSQDYNRLHNCCRQLLFVVNDPNNPPTAPINMDVSKSMILERLEYLTILQPDKVAMTDAEINTVRSNEQRHLEAVVNLE